MSSSCPSCGAKLAPEARFCSSCGAQVDEGASEKGAPKVLPAGLPSEMRAKFDDISATVTDGVLTVTVPRPAEESPKRIAVS